MRPVEDQMLRVVAERHQQFAESASLGQTIKTNLKRLGFGE